MRVNATAAIGAVALLLAVPASASSGAPSSLHVAHAQQDVSADLLCKLLGSATAAAVATKLRARISPRSGSAILSAVAGLAVTFCPNWAPKATRATQKLIQWFFGSNKPPPAVDSEPPTMFAPQSAVRGDWFLATNGSVEIGAYWSALDLGSGVASYELAVSRNGSPWESVTLPNSSIPNMSIPAASGGTYQFEARARDVAGNWSSWRAGRVLKVVTYNDNAAKFSSRDWTASRLVGAVNGDVTFTKTAGATATLSFSASAISVVASMFPGAGAAEFWIDNHYVARIDLYSPTFKQRGVVAGWQWPTFGSHTLTLRNVQIGSRSELQLDAFVLLGT
jgi:hypothetical protein